jgi:BirA family biotin operon repressor/biotin-[acetyl-CoA-carboxylase] ligase
VSLDRDLFEALLQTEIIGRTAGWKNEVWDDIDSTNARALTLAAEGAPHGLVIAARQQSAGRGRLGRTWVSPSDSGLYMTFVLRLNLPATTLPLVSLAAGTASVRGIENTCGVRAGLKWVNDVVYAGKKIGGILCEMQTQPALVVGVGINLRLFPADMPDEIRHSADCLEHITGAPVDTNVLAANLCLEMEKAAEKLNTPADRAEVLRQWKRYSVTLGRRVTATCAGNQTTGTAIDLAPDGGLVIEDSSGQRITLHAGEVSIRGEDGSYT